MYSTQVCPYCVMAEKLLLKKGVSNLEKILIDRRVEQMTAEGVKFETGTFVGKDTLGKVAANIVSCMKKSTAVNRTA
mgnify:CR=1 FL=1